MTRLHDDTLSASGTPGAPSVFRHVTPPEGATLGHVRPRRGERQEKLVLSPGARPLMLEQYRKLAASLHHAQAQHGLRIVMVSSTLAGEGKTLTATNLALTFSESYRRRVALIDADLRRPTVHDMFGLPNISGLNDALDPKGGACELFDVTPNLSVLTAGRPNPDPMSGLTSDRMRRLIDAAAGEFDWVIVDTPPVGLLTDAKLLGAMVDTVVLVVASGRTPYRLVHRTVETLGRDRIFGVVLNRVASTVVWGDYGSYDYDAYTSR